MSVLTSNMSYMLSHTMSCGFPHHTHSSCFFFFLRSPLNKQALETEYFSLIIPQQLSNGKKVDSWESFGTTTLM